MNNQPIVLCEEDLAEIHGGDMGDMILAGLVAWAVAKAMDGAGAAASEIANAADSLNAYIGSPGAYNPYSNPINCEYAGYY